MKSLLVLVFLGSAAVLGAQAPLDEARLKALLAQDKTVVLLDVRTAEEFAEGHLNGAKLLPYDAIDAASAAKAAAKTQTVVVYCRSGRRSALAAQTLKSLGYAKVWDFGGLANWKGPLVR